MPTARSSTNNVPAAVARKQLEEFKKKVIETVLEFQKEHELCEDGVADFFDELGLTELVPKAEKEFIVKIKITGDREFSELDVEGWMDDSLGNVSSYSDSRNVDGEVLSVEAVKEAKTI